MEISYGHDALHAFDYYAPSGPPLPRPLLVFVHGGAWRSEDKADHAELAQTLVTLTSCPVAVPNYRLTKPENPVQHPAHARDVLRCLHFLSTWPGPSPAHPSAEPTQLVLLGHSCAAHILASILLASPFPDLTPAPQLLARTRAVILSEGIYDLDALLRSFPAYKSWFIANTFGDRPAYPDVNVASYPLRPGTEHIRWLVLHSTGDSLVDSLQSESMYAHLASLLRHRSAAVPVPMVSKSFDEMDEGHNELLKGTVYPRILARYVNDTVNLWTSHAPPV